MIIFLYGSDTLRSMQKLKELKNKFIKEVDKFGFNLAEIEGEKLSLNDFRKEVGTMPFMAKRRMSIFKNISKSKKKDLEKGIIDYLKDNNSSEDNIVILWEDEKKPQSSLFKFLTNKNNLKIYKQEFEPLKGVELYNWIAFEIKKRGAQISREGITLLIEKIGTDLWQMDNELEKLINYDKNISFENIKEMVKSKNDENIFNLTDAIGGKNKKLSIHLLSQELESGINTNYILTMLERHYRLLLELKDYLSKEGNNSSPLKIGKDLSLHPFAAKKLLNQVNLYKSEKLNAIYREITMMDIKSKTSNVDIELLMDMLIIKN